MEKLRSKFDDFLAQALETPTDYLRRNAWLDAAGLGPDLEVIRPLLGPQEEPLPDDLDFILANAYRVGAAFEGLGRMDSALAWYRLGQFMWRGERQFQMDLGKDPPEIMAREAAGQNQLPAAVCADRVGETKQAQQLYDWAAYNSTLTPEEVRYHTTEGVLMPLWEFHSPRAYALACLERWGEAREVAEHLHHHVSQDADTQKESYQAPLRILPVALALARYKTEPTEKHRRRAHQMLQLQAVATRSHTDHLIALFYLFNLRARHPDLAAPQAGEALSPEGARQAADLCQKWAARQGNALDRNPESFKLLDPLLRPSYQAAPDEEARAGMVFLWGSYFGEVLREELAGGQWDFEDKDRLGASLAWDMGGGQLRLLPYKHLLQILTGTTRQSLYELWQVTEREYVQMGLAARDAD